jgi:glycosyltransferase involved in cell wall biosynthesis
VEAIASRFSDAELVQSQEDFDFLRQRRIYPPRRTTLLGNGIDLERFSPDKVSTDRRRQLRLELDIDDDEVVVGIVGRLVAEKGYPELFDAAERLNGAITVLAIGDRDPDKPDAVDEAAMKKAKAAGVRFLGFRNDIDSLYPAMDIFALPSHREGIPRSAMEASAMGLPVVSTDIRGCREVVEHGVTGLLVPVKDPEALAQALAKMAGDCNLRRSMGEAGRQRALECFDEEVIVRTVIETYLRLARDKSKRLKRRAAYVSASHKRGRPLMGRGE